MAAFLATTSLQKAWLARNGLANAEYPGLKDVHTALLRQIRATGETPVVHPAGAWNIGTALLLELSEDGLVPRVLPRDRWILGSGLPTPEDTIRPLHVFPGTPEHPLILAPCLDFLVRSAGLEVGASRIDVRECAPDHVGFGSGFYPLEVGADGHTWRWMARRGEVRLPNEQSGEKKLRLVGSAPIQLIAAPPTIRVLLGAHLLDSFLPTNGQFSKEYIVPSELFDSAPGVLLAIETNRVVSPPGDPRALGVLIDELSLSSVP